MCVPLLGCWSCCCLAAAAVLLLLVLHLMCCCGDGSGEAGRVGASCTCRHPRLLPHASPHPPLPTRVQALPLPRRRVCTRNTSCLTTTAAFLSFFPQVLEYAATHYDAAFVLKTDDDAFINVGPMMDQLRALCEYPGCVGERLYMGKMARHSEVLLQPGHKWNNAAFYNHTGGCWGCVAGSHGTSAAALAWCCPLLLLVLVLLCLHVAAVAPCHFARTPTRITHTRADAPCPPPTAGLKTYPNYMMGGGYVLGGEVARVLVDVHARMRLKFTPIEDATLGFWLASMDLRHIDHPRFYTWAAPCCFKAPLRCVGCLLTGQAAG